MQKKRKLILTFVVVCGLIVWQLSLLKELLAAWILFAIAFVPLLVVSFGLALFEDAGERGVTRAESYGSALIREARRGLTRVTVWLNQPYRHAH